MTTRKSITFTLIALPFITFLIVLMIYNGLKVGFFLWVVASVISFIAVLLGLTIVYFLPKKWTYTLNDFNKRQIKPVKHVQTNSRKKRNA